MCLLLACCKSLQLFDIRVSLYLPMAKSIQNKKTLKQHSYGEQAFTTWTVVPQVQLRF
jgi:hypothetical protein